MYLNPAKVFKLAPIAAVSFLCRVRNFATRNKGYFALAYGVQFRMSAKNPVFKGTSKPDCNSTKFSEK